MFSVASVSILMSAQLRWELGSPVFGMLLRRYAPHDTYEVRPWQHKSIYMLPTFCAAVTWQLSCLIRFMRPREGMGSCCCAHAIANKAVIA